MNFNKYSTFILRLGLGIVFLIFGIGKFRNDVWAQTIRNMDFFNSIPVKIDILIYLIGSFEVIVALLLILGFFTRIAALLASLQLTFILILLNFATIRDIGLLALSVSLSMTGSNYLSLDNLTKYSK